MHAHWVKKVHFRLNTEQQIADLDEFQSESAVLDL